MQRLLIFCAVLLLLAIGYSPLDSQTRVIGDIDVGTVHSFQSAQGFAAENLTVASGSLAWNLDNAQVAIATIDQTTTLANPTNQRAGFTYTLIALQGADGDETLAFGSAYLFPGGVAPTLTTGAGSVDLVSCLSDGTNMHCGATQDFQ